MSNYLRSSDYIQLSDQYQIDNTSHFLSAVVVSPAVVAGVVVAHLWTEAEVVAVLSGAEEGYPEVDPGELPGVASWAGAVEVTTSMVMKEVGQFIYSFIFLYHWGRKRKSFNQCGFNDW